MAFATAFPRSADRGNAIDGKWTPLIVYYLKVGKQRFGRLRRNIPEVPRKIVTEQFRQQNRVSYIQQAGAVIKRNPVVSFFALSFAVSWVGALAVAAPHFIRHQPFPRMSRILMFPAMLLGPSLAGLVLTRIVDGKNGLRALFSRLFNTRVPPVWYAALLIPPALVLAVLVFLQRFASPVYAPNHFFMGIVFGVPAGFLEEIGWMGYAFPKMRSRGDALAPSILLGLLWSLWHLPVIDNLGAATPHGVYRLPFFLAFTLAMTAMRVLIAWIYTNTKSLWLAQLMHVSSTGALVIFGAAHVTAGQEAIWYAFYGVLLWVTVAIVAKTFGRSLVTARSVALSSAGGGLNKL